MVEEESDHAYTVPPLAYLAATLGLVLLIKSLLGSKEPANLPPFPVKGYPILGHLPYLKGGMRKQLSKWKEIAGDVYSIYFGPRLVVILNSYDTAYQAFVKNADTLSDRPPSIAFSKELSEQGILTSSGHLWKEQRTVTLQILRAFGMGKNMLAVKVSEEVSAYLDALAQLSGKPSDVRTLTNTTVSNVICSIIVGRRFEFGDEFFVKFIHMLDEQVQLASANSLATVFTWLRYLPGDRFKAKRRLRNFYQIKNFFCDHFIEKTEKEYDEDNMENFISAYLFEIKKLERQGKDTTLDKLNLSRVLGNLFVAGTETTSTTILWFMIYMLHFPEEQKKVFKEIKEVIGTERAPTLQDRPKLNYTNAAIQETLRLASIVPTGLPHYANRDTTVGNYTIPAGAIVMVNFDAILLNPHTWNDPLTFRPERFLDDQGNLTHSDHLVPFSLGRRLCLGEALAKMELFLFLSGLVQRFELQPEEPGKLPPREAIHGATGPPVEFKVRLVDRREQ